MTAVLDLPVPDGYEPLRGGLIGRRHKDQYSAALSVAANRASKVAKLVDAGREDIAARYLADLRADCADFLTTHPAGPARFAASLELAATPYAITFPPCPYGKDDPVRLPNGLTGTVSHSYPAADGRSRRVAVTVTRSATPPHPRHGARWTEQYAADPVKLQVISAAQVTEHPVTAPEDTVSS